ncbi:hypothetical protein BOX15_Mlig005832g2, partial [Macrostomum lignano]
TPEQFKHMSKTKASAAMPGAQQLKKPQGNYTNTSRGVAGGVGAVDEETFLNAFEQVPRIHISNGRDVTEHLSRAREILSGNVEDWEKRVECLKQLRSLVLAGGAEYDEFAPGLRALEVPFRTCVTDLRSLVVREACITVAHLSRELSNKFDHFAESVLESLLSLIANSTKVISTSGIVATRLLLRNSHAPRLLPILCQFSQSKSAIQRRYLYEFLAILFANWPAAYLEKQVTAFADVFRRGLVDADQEGRAHSRRAFWLYWATFRDPAEQLLKTLDAKTRQAVEKDRPGSTGPAMGSAATSALPKAAGKPLSATTGTTGLPRSTSDHNSLMTAATAGAGRVLAPSARTLRLGQQQQQQQRGRTATKTGGSTVSQSTPASREASPSSRYSYLTYQQQQQQMQQQQQQKQQQQQPYQYQQQRVTPSRPKGPRSQGASREASPGRGGSGIPVPSSGSGGMSSLRRQSQGARTAALVNSGGGTYRTGASSASRRASGSENDAAAQSALAEALQYKLARASANGGGEEASETSSVCSDSSYKSFNNIADIIKQLESRDWSQRRDGLASLTSYLSRDSCRLNSAEVRNICDIFTRLFGETNGRVTQFFLEALGEFVTKFHAELHDWLYTLQMRLLGRLATETLTSQQSRVQAALERVRMAFPPELQFQQLLRSVCDQWLQTLPKVQLAVLQHLLMSLPDLPSHALQSNADTKAVVARLAALTREPRSADLRRYSQMLLAGLARLNNDSFANILQSLAGPMQQRVAEVVANQQEASATAAGLQQRRGSLGTAATASGTGRNAGQQSSSQQGTSFSPEEMSSCIRQAAQDIQSLTGTSSAGPATWAEPRSVASAAAAAATSSRNGQTNQRLANRNYQQQQPAYQLPSYQADPFSADDYQQLMMQPQPQQQSLQSGDLLLADIVRELSGARNQRHEQRKFCMQRLIGLVRDKTALNWDDHFKNILLILLETLSENESDIRACALSALQELLRAESARFVDFVEVTVLKVLEAHRDQDRSVAKAADDCAKALSACLPADQILRVLIPIVLDSEVPITLAAIKMEMRVVQEADSGLLERLLAELCPGLVRACEHQESPIRKAAIFCLVQVQLKVGDSLMLHLGDMSGTKRRLLQLYICRARAPQQQQQQQLAAF